VSTSVGEPPGAFSARVPDSGGPTDRERAHWVAFNRTPGIAGKGVTRLQKRFGTLEAAWTAPAAALAEAGLDRRAVAALETARKQIYPERELERVRRVGARAITWQDAEYPARLAAIPDPPPVLYVRGTLLHADAFALAVVGTRRATVYGRETTERLCAELAAVGVTIVSGLAKGIDTRAHRGALTGGGRTIAVLGNGIDVCYPAENRRLADAIAERGALVSDYAVGVGPIAENFPPRNRIISGLAAGVLVTEAGDRSGALITSRFAAEQGRDVFAVPGPITSPASSGCHRLIQDGAKLVACSDDVLQELNPYISAANVQQLRLGLDEPALAPTAGTTGGVPGAIDAPGVAGEAALLRLLAEAGQPVHVDQLARTLAVPVHEVTGLLALLEVQGRVQHAGGLRYATATR
jgi:DNA processing protein